MINPIEALDKTIELTRDSGCKVYVIFDNSNQWETWVKFSGYSGGGQHKDNPVFFYFKSGNQRIGFVDCIDK